MLKPRRVFLSSNQTRKITTRAMMKPKCRRVLGMSLKKTVDLSISGDCGQPESGLFQGPLSRKLMTYPTTEFISRVVTTSSTESFTLSSAGMSTQAAPAMNPPKIIAGIPSAGDTLWMIMPRPAPAAAPAIICPSAPILKKPEAKATVTAIPVRKSGVVFTRISIKLERLERGSTRM
ncbi:hypothetical protein SDC9_100536 [bioreactor metagenome]|uniref:Uncharacterized protein n=1 Tax=bioreactor metagenome TaxID=1076179 RepID=A0A645AL62_9ZZZZ